MNDISTFQFILLAVAFVSGVMIGLQGAVKKAIWGGHLLLFFGSSIGFAATVLLR